MPRLAIARRSRGADARAGSGRAATPTAEAQKRAPAVGALPPSLDIATRPASPAEQGGPCGVRFHSEFWGDVVRWGADHKVSTWQECCAACQEFVPGGPDAPLCNVWVWCGDERLCGPQFHECWLKHLAHPTASRPRAEGDGVGWTSGLLPVANDPFDPGFYDSIGALDETDAERKYHYVITAQGQATHWQARINYFWWRVMKAKCLEEQGDACQMGTYTRLLHSGQPDDLGAVRQSTHVVSAFAIVSHPSPIDDAPQWTRSPLSWWTPSLQTWRTPRMWC